MFGSAVGERLAGYNGSYDSLLTCTYIVTSGRVYPLKYIARKEIDAHKDHHTTCI
jgi:hypothetical protein